MSKNDFYTISVVTFENMSPSLFSVMRGSFYRLQYTGNNSYFFDNPYQYAAR